MQKLSMRHNVTRQEVIDCFANRDTDYTPLTDNREEHKTDPATEWFISVTDYGRTLKIIYVQKEFEDDAGNIETGIFLKSAYVPNKTVIDDYYKTAKN